MESKTDQLIKLYEDAPDQLSIILRVHFLTYFRVMHTFVNGAPPIIKPFHKQIAKKLQSIVEGTNEKRNLALCLPVGSGKSLIIQYFISWCFARSVNNAFVYTSHSQDNISKMSRETRDICTNDFWVNMFGGVVKGDQKSVWNWAFADANKRTGLMAKPLGAGVTGMDAGIGSREDFSGALIIDDPLDAGKSRSQIEKRNTAQAYDEKLATRRRSSVTPTILVMQRLAIDDLIGWIEENEPDQWDILKISALNNEISFWPERYPVEELKRIEQQNKYKFNAQYQQSPIADSGIFFHTEGFKVVDHIPAGVSVQEEIRAWDKAGTEASGAYTAGVKMAKLDNGQYIVLDVVRGQWSFLQREQIIKSTAENDGVHTHIWIEQEPGSGGKESAENTIRNLAGFTIRAERPTGDKATRAEPYASQVEAGNVLLLRGQWNNQFIDEHRYFPDGTYKDQVDASAQAFNKLATFIEEPLAAEVPPIRYGRYDMFG